MQDGGPGSVGEHSWLAKGTTAVVMVLLLQCLQRYYSAYNGLTLQLLQLLHATTATTAGYKTPVTKCR